MPGAGLIGMGVGMGTGVGIRVATGITTGWLRRSQRRTGAANVAQAQALRSKKPPGS